MCVCIYILHTHTHKERENEILSHLQFFLDEFYQGSETVNLTLNIFLKTIQISNLILLGLLYEKQINSAINLV